MKAFKIFAMALLMILIAQGKIFAAMPEVSASETYFDVFKGVYVLKGNVHVAINNHGFQADVKADESQVSVVNQKCWANGHVKLEHGNIIFGCDRAYLQGQDKTVYVKGKVKFENKNSVAINSDTAIFNWQDKIVDFYGKITLNAGKNLKFARGVKLTGKEYQHVQYNVEENKILALDKTFRAPEIVIPEVGS